MRHLKKKLLLDTLAIVFTICHVYAQPDCDVQVSFDAQPPATYGASYGDNAGDLIFTESGIDVRIDSMLWFGGSLGYNFVNIEAASCGFGFDQIASFNNASLIFDLSSIATNGVSFIFRDMGGEENLQVNGSTIHVISKFEDLPSWVAPNVQCVVDSVYADTCYGVKIGRVTLSGNINLLRIAGQELSIDSLCIDENTSDTIPGDTIPENYECETQVGFDDQPPNTYGASYGDNAGDMIFTESGIDVSIDSILWFSGSRGYNLVEIQAADCGFGFDQRAWFNNAALIFDLSAITTDGVSFIFWDHGGEENLQVNGATEFVVTDFMALPSIVAPNVTCAVYNVYKDNCTGVDIGRVILTGNINELRIAGQELAVDSICINEAPSAIFENTLRNTSYYLAQNYPNPCRISTTISYSLPEPGMVSLKIFDLYGREIQELVNQYQTGNQYTVNFNTESLSNGIYYYKLQVNDFVDIKKILLVKQD